MQVGAERAGRLGRHRTCRISRPKCLYTCRGVPRSVSAALPCTHVVAITWPFQAPALLAPTHQPARGELGLELAGGLGRRLGHARLAVEGLEEAALVVVEAESGHVVDLWAMGGECAHEVMRSTPGPSRGAGSEWLPRAALLVAGSGAQGVGWGGLTPPTSMTMSSGPSSSISRLRTSFACFHSGSCRSIHTPSASSHWNVPECVPMVRVPACFLAAGSRPDMLAAWAMKGYRT